MEFSPRRVVLFVLVSALLLISWQSFILPKLLPPRQKAGPQAQAPNQKPGKQKPEPKKPPAHIPAIAEKPAKPQAPQPGAQKLKRFPHKDDISLGSIDPHSGFFYHANCTTEGAAVSRIELNDPRYRNLENPKEPLALAEPTEDKNGDVFRTFQTDFPELDRLLAGERVNLKTVDWQFVEDQSNQTQAVFRYEIPGKFRLEKRYELKKGNEKGGYSKETRDTNTEGYFLHLTVSCKNLAAEKTDGQYKLQGPVGMPLEDPESTRKFRDIKLGTVKGGKVSDDSVTAKDLVKSIEKNDVEEWSAPFRYVGVDGQFFATLLYNGSDKPTTEKIANYKPEAIWIDQNDPQMSEVSIELTSKPLVLAEGEGFEHHYTLYAGPKRQALLENMQAGAVLEFGWFGWISKGMLAVLSFLHNALLFPYGIAIICLTIMVRGALFPLSRKQAQSAARMKELQPKLAELKKKYGDDKQKFAQAQMDLFRDAGYNPFAGCLPMVFQLPIFIGLYSALNHAVDLRAAPFLWIDNLAAPDQLFKFPFRVPFLGWYFNLLPLVTVVLFIVQQKMFMPAPDPEDEQAKMQHKMMNFMMIFMGFLFYHVPAGLCVYFIASSLWGMGERKALDIGKKKASDGSQAGELATVTSATRGGTYQAGPQNGRDKRQNTASKKRGKKSKSRR